MLDTVETRAIDAATGWFADLDAATTPSEIGDLFLEDSYWRDAVGLGPGLQTLCGRREVSGTLAEALAASGDVRFGIDPAVSPHWVTRVETETLEIFFTFETRTGRGRGILRLCQDADGTLKAWTLLTALEEIKGHEERSGANRPTGQSHSRDFRGPNWLDQRQSAQSYADRDPAVLVIGGGQAGLAIAARLTQMCVDTLIVDKNARIGDNWRNRYHALTLHNQVQVNHLPYMPFPPGWPTYIPKDKLANWFEAYVEAMELNFWTGTELTGGHYDEAEGHWIVTLRRDGVERTMRPRHIVMATGVSGIPNIPEIPTIENFEGPVLHSSRYQDGEDWTGKRAIIIGTGNSGHDIAQDLTSSGAHVTLVQRSPTLVVNIEPSAQLPYKIYGEGLATEECDLIATSMPTPLMRKAHQAYTSEAKLLDKPLLDRLEARGFRLDFGDDETGWQFKYLTRGGGYYFNVGCADMIADGKVDLVQYADIDGFTKSGAVLRDGSHVDADLIVLSTGYQRQEILIAKLFGQGVADRVGQIWGFGDGEELRNMYCETDQPGLWFIAGSLAQCRINSKYLALQIKAQEIRLDDGELT